MNMNKLNKRHLGNYTTPKHRFCDTMTVEEFLGCVACDHFTDDDGYGHPMKNDLEDISIYIFPSQCQQIPEDATHICWYNK